MQNYVRVGSSEIWTIINEDVDISKPFLCLCIGGPGIGDALLPVDNLIKKNFNIIRFEQRGCGRSTKDGNYSIDTVINDLEEIRKFYNVKKWYVGGHSWGASVALFYGLKYQDACSGIIYISGIGIQNDNDWAEEFHNNSEKLNEPEFTLPQGLEINFDVLNVGLRSHNDYIKQATLLKDISKFEVPVLILYGRKDIRPMWPAMQLANLLPKSRIEIFEEGNHFLWEQEPDKFVKTISDWVNYYHKIA